MARRETGTVTGTLAGPPGKVPVDEPQYGPGPVDESKPIPKGATCQEATRYTTPTLWAPCGAPATHMVRHDKDGRSYLFCAADADHNVRNRGGVLVKKRRVSKSEAATVQLATLATEQFAPSALPIAPASGLQLTTPPNLNYPIQAGSVIKLEIQSKAGPDPLLPFADVALVAELEGVPLLSFVTQAIHFMDQGKQIQQFLDGKKGEDGKTLEGGLRPAINDFLERAGAPGFLYMDESGATVRAFSFRRVTTERATLDELLLLQNGVAADVIERSRRKSVTTALTIREIKG